MYLDVTPEDIQHERASPVYGGNEVKLEQGVDPDYEMNDQNSGENHNAQAGIPRAEDNGQAYQWPHCACDRCVNARAVPMDTAPSGSQQDTPRKILDAIGNRSTTAAVQPPTAVTDANNSDVVAGPSTLGPGGPSDRGKQLSKSPLDSTTAEAGYQAANKGKAPDGAIRTTQHDHAAFRDRCVRELRDLQDVHRRMAEHMDDVLYYHEQTIRRIDRMVSSMVKEEDA